jgi:integrase
MPKKKLTDRTLQALPSAGPGKRYTVWDTETPALAVRVTDRGTRTFVVMRRRPGHKNPDRVKLGTYPDMSLKEAREKADEARKDLKRGVHPKEREEQRLREAARKRKDTFSSVAEEFLRRHVSKLRTAREVEVALRRDLVKRWAARPITDITRGDVVEMLEEIMDRGDGKRRGQVSYAAHHALSYARKLFNWAIAREMYGLEASPCDRISAKDLIGAKAKRKRVLSDDELRVVWRAATGLGYPLGPFVRLLIVTGQRLRECSDTCWSEFNLGDAPLWTIGAARMKGDAAHEIPIAPLAVELLQGLPKFRGGPYVFTSTAGKKPVNGFSKMKARLDRAIAEANGGEPIDGFTFHDIRRTMRTRLSALPIPDEVRELMIAHARPGLHQVYDLHRFHDEKRRGFELWARRLIEIVEPPPANVVALRGTA